jgi:tetratricopeptide (TPR) repeat protein
VSADSLTTRDSERPARVWIHRALAAVAIPVLLLLGLEGGLRLAGFGKSVRFLIPDDKPGYYRTNPDFAGSFLPGNFDLRPLNFRVSARKPANTVRIVVLGESAAEGIPVPSFAFAAQLRAQLRARRPDREFEVINTGIVAINSHVIYQIARELSGFAPDLFVVYMGNNEVVGPYGPGCAYLSEMPPMWIIRLSVFVRSTRTGQLMADLLGRLAGRGRPPAEWGGMAMFVNNSVRGDDPRLEAVYRNFEANLGDIVRVAQGAGARTLLCTVASNIRDCAPFLSLHREGLADPELAAWGRAFNRGRIEWLIGDRSAARDDLLQALPIDPQYADTSFMLGAIDLEDGKVESARRHLLDAEHWDALRFRPDPRINEAIRRVARGNAPSVSLLDAALLMGSDPASDAAPAGRGIFFEHVHFDWDGNYMLARAMAEASEAALFGAEKGALPWLGSPGCAAALGYTAHERPTMLQKIATIVQNPPFTNQLTYCEDEARLAHGTALARADAADPGKLRLAKEVVQAAGARDPENADLAKLAEDIDDDMGDLPGALAQARRAGDLQPDSFALGTDEAIKLSRLGRYSEAERLLEQTAASCPPRDRVAMAPAFADLFTRTRRFDDGRRYLDGEISRHPTDASLRLLRGRLSRLAGDNAGAERELRAILAADPGNPGALEELVNMLGALGRTAEAEKATLGALERQPRNLANNLRAAIICDTRGDDAQAVRSLLAAERSGPVTSGVELWLARKLFGLRRPDEALTRLAEARRISSYEGDPAVTRSIGQAIENVMRQMR